MEESYFIPISTVYVPKRHTDNKPALAQLIH